MSQQLQLLAHKIYEFCGLNYFTNITSLELKVSRRLNHLQVSSLMEYDIYLNTHPEEWWQLVEELTINETYFFREEKQLYLYMQHILPSLKNETPIRVWSAACSTGEEPYTLAMLSHEAGFTSNQQLQIVATDINTKVLQRAKRGIYNKRSLSFRRIEEQWLMKYFLATPSTYEVMDSVKQQVSFQYLNLLQQRDIEAFEEFDVIFCRNVFIYFDEETIYKIISSFYKVLKPGGYLFLGHAESITKFKNIGFETINQNGTFYYRKG